MQTLWQLAKGLFCFSPQPKQEKAENPKKSRQNETIKSMMIQQKKQYSMMLIPWYLRTMR